MNTEVKPKPSPLSTADAIGIALIASIGFFFLYPWLTLIAVFMHIPVLSTVVVFLADLPVKLLPLQLPNSDVLGFKVTVAKFFWLPVVFAVTFLLLRRRGRQGGRSSETRPH